VRNTSDNFGLGLQGKVSSRIDVGANVTQAKVTDDFGLTVLVQTTPATPVVQLDSIETKVTTFGLYGKYALNRQSGVRLDWIYDQYQTDDWTWSRWVYADGTTVMQDPNQKVNFVGVTYYYKFQ
jgi:predicted porin